MKIKVESLGNTMFRAFVEDNPDLEAFYEKPLEALELLVYKFPLQFGIEDIEIKRN